MSFVVNAHIDDVRLIANAETAKEAFAKAVGWHVVESFTDVSISDGIKTSLIAEFSSRMALLEIANTTETTAEPELRGSK